MKETKPRLYILPGWGHRLSDKEYRDISHTKNFTLTPLRLRTRNRRYVLGGKESFASVIRAIEKQIRKPTERDVILGFSIGALEAYKLAERYTFAHLILCSTSVVIGSDLKTYPKDIALKIFSPNQYREMQKLRFGSLKTKKVTVLYGEKEDTLLKKRSQLISKKKGVTLIEVKGADHYLNGEYRRQLKKLLK